MNVYFVDTVLTVDVMMLSMYNYKAKNTFC